MAGPFPHAEVRAAITALDGAHQDLRQAESLSFTALLDAYEDWTGATYAEFSHWNQQHHARRTALYARLTEALEVLRAAEQAAG